MTPLDIAARVVTSPVTHARAVLDVNDNGPLGWPDALAWLFFATLGLFGVAVVLGMVFLGVTAAVHGMAQIGRSARIGAHRVSVDRRR